MTALAIHAEGLSKQYKIGGGPREPYGSLRESLARAASAPLRQVRSLVGGHRDGGTSIAGDTSLWALRDVSFDVKHGEAIGIIGRNGAGKSTLLKILSRITEPTTGRAELYGRIGSLLEVGTGFHPELTGRENIYLNGAILGMTRTDIRHRFDEIVAFAEVEKFIDTPVKRYSSGMYMRLAFSVAAHLEPDILVVDEVLAVGDLEFQKKCLGKMGAVTSEGRTVLFVSHNMAAIQKLCGQCVLLEHGRVKTLGRAENVIKQYVDSHAHAQATNLPTATLYSDAPGYAYKLVVENGNGIPAATVPVGQPWQVRITFTITERTEHFIIALGLRTSDDMNLRTSWSSPLTLEPGNYQAVFREDTVLLAAGGYPLAMGLSTHERTFYYLDNAGILEIAQYSEGIDLVRISGVGAILNPLDIYILPLDAPRTTVK